MSKSTLSSGSQPPNNFLEELQDSIVRRLSKTPLSRNEPVVYEFTNDRALLHQYYRIREVMYRKTANAYKMGDEDVYDKLAHVLIARRGKLVIGGCRLIIREADEEFLLPMETPDFKLRDVFPNLPLRKLRHGEVSRFTVMDDDNNLEIMRDLTKLISEKCIDLGLGFGFFKSTLPMARDLRKVLSLYCGLNKTKICTEIQVPENPIHPEITWYITEILLPVGEVATAYEDVTRPAEALVH